MSGYANSRQRGDLHAATGAALEIVDSILFDHWRACVRTSSLTARSIHRSHDVSRPAPHFYIDAPDVLADKSEGEKYHPDKKEQDRKKRPQRAFFLRTVDQSMSQHYRGQDRV